MVRTSRQNKILELIEKKDIETQTELMKELNFAGFTATQATVSRDIRELGLIKTISATDKYKYVFPETKPQNNKLLTIFKESVVAIEKAINLIVLKTISGSANSACLIIDKLNIKGVAGTLAGDDTIVVIIKTIEEVNDVYNELKKLLNKK